MRATALLSIACTIKVAALQRLLDDLVDSQWSMVDGVFLLPRSGTPLTIDYRPSTKKKPHGKEMKANCGCLLPLCPGAYSEGVLPGPIPNPEVKPLSADDTAPRGCGNVGRCRA